MRSPHYDRILYQKSDPIQLRDKNLPEEGEIWIHSPSPKDSLGSRFGESKKINYPSSAVKNSSEKRSPALSANAPPLRTLLALQERDLSPHPTPPLPGPPRGEGLSGSPFPLRGGGGGVRSPVNQLQSLRVWVLGILFFAVPLDSQSPPLSLGEGSRVGTNAGNLRRGVRASCSLSL